MVQDAPSGILQGKGRVEHGPTEMRWGPNAKGWKGPAVSIVHAERLVKEMEGFNVSEGPSGVRS